jgi:hypothetical protein
LSTAILIHPFTSIVIITLIVSFRSDTFYTITSPTTMDSTHNDKSEIFESVDLKAPPNTTNSDDEEVPSSPTSIGHNGIKPTASSSSSIQMGPPDTWPGDEDEEPEDLDDKVPASSTPSSPTGDTEKGGMEMSDGDGDDGSEASPSPSPKDGIVKPPAKKKKKPEMNPKFKDVQETGKWGEMSQKEFIIAITFFVLIIIAAVLVVLFVVVLPNNEDGSADTGNTTGQVSYVPAPTLSPTPPPTNLPPQDELALVLAAIQENPVTSPIIQIGDLSEDVTFYQGLAGTATATPQQKAMSWLLYQDEAKDPTQSVVRFALASIYYQNGGDGWVSSNGWLSSAPLCDWDHINCDSRGFMQELEFDEQNLSGNLALEFALLGENLQSILMSRNNLDGAINAAVFASLPRLGLLYLDNNLLTGTVPVELVSDARLRK